MSTPLDATLAMNTEADHGVHPDPSRIIVPRKHGQLLIEPPLKHLQTALQATASQSDSHSAFGIDFSAARSSARAVMLKAANAWAARTGAPALPEDAQDKQWILTGHQVEFYHPGVWAKVLAVDALAARTHQLAFDLLVDHDVIDHLGFDIPIESDGTWSKKIAEWNVANALPAESLHAPSPEGYARWRAQIATFPQAHSDTLNTFLDQAPKDTSTGSYVEWLSSARQLIERTFKLNVHHVPATEVCAGDTWHSYIHAWVTHADHWTDLYNRHLADYRQRQGIKNPQHPMPDLQRTGNTVELPFWIYEKGSPRERLLIRRTPERTVALYRDQEFLLRKGVLPSNPNLVIRPRALAFTMFVRLFLADLFIHGIGGALYDQITDALMTDIVGRVPPYGCVSAAWLLPIGQPFENTDDLAALRWRRHHVKHNPQLAIDPFIAVNTQVAELILARKTLITDIAHSLETARRSREARATRRDLFRRLQEVNKELHLHAPRMLDRLDTQIADAERMQSQNKVLLWREYFFALHTHHSLAQLKERIAAS